MSDPGNALVAVMEQARQARADQDKSRAHTLYVRATQLDQGDVSAWMGRASVSPDADDAIVSWAHALTLVPQNQEARSMLAQAVQQRIAQSDARDAKRLVALGRDLAAAGQKSFAHQLFVFATQLSDRDDEAWVWRAGSTDSASEAISCLNRALALNPDNTKASAGLRWILTQQFSSIAVTPESAGQAAKQVAEGQRLFNLGDKSRAREFFVRATELDHRNESAWLWRGSSTNNVDEALMCMEQALVINPENRAAQDARQWLRARKLQPQTQTPETPSKRVLPPPIPISPPVLLPMEEGEPNRRTRGLLLAISAILLILLLVNFLQKSGYIP